MCWIELVLFRPICATERRRWTGELAGIITVLISIDSDRPSVRPTRRLVAHIAALPTQHGVDRSKSAATQSLLLVRSAQPQRREGGRDIGRARGGHSNCWLFHTRSQHFRQQETDYFAQQRTTNWTDWRSTRLFTTDVFHAEWTIDRSVATATYSEILIQNIITDSRFWTDERLDLMKTRTVKGTVNV